MKVKVKVKRVNGNLDKKIESIEHGELLWDYSSNSNNDLYVGLGSQENTKISEQVSKIGAGHADDSERAKTSEAAVDPSEIKKYNLTKAEATLGGFTIESNGDLKPNKNCSIDNTDSGKNFALKGITKQTFSTASYGTNNPPTENVEPGQIYFKLDS